MARQVVDASARCDAAPEAVWRLAADSATYPDWGTWDERSLEREGEPPPEGVGAIRLLTTGRVVVREQIVVFDPPRRVAYRLLEGLPLRDYQAEITLEPAEDGGTTIRWRAEFAAKLPGTGGLFRRRLQKLFEELVERLASAASDYTGP